MIQYLLQSETQSEEAKETRKIGGELILRVWNPSDRNSENGERWRNRGINRDSEPERGMHFQLWRDKQKRCDKIKNRNRSTVHLFIIWEGRREKWWIDTTKKMQPQSLRIKKILWRKCQLRGQSTDMHKWATNQENANISNHKWKKTMKPRERKPDTFKSVAEWKVSDGEMPHKH